MPVEADPGRLRIRLATPADAEPLARLHLASYRAAYQSLLPAEALSSLRAEDRHRRWQVSLSDARRRTLIAEHADAVPALIGFAEVGPSRDDDAGTGMGELMSLHVRQSCWRAGVGRALHDRAVASLAAGGFQAATLWVLAGNWPARAFYEAMGWNHDGTAREHVVRGVQVAEIRYRAGCLDRPLSPGTDRPGS